MTAAAMFLFGVVLGLVAYAWVTRPERRKVADDLEHARIERDRVYTLYRESVQREALWLGQVGPDFRAWAEELR